MPEQSREARITKEKKRISRQFSKIDKKKKQICLGLIERAAHLLVYLEDLETDLEENGFTEQFQQGKNQDPYDRKRPNAELYVSMNSQYLKTISQLAALLPKEEKPQQENDLLDDFVQGRQDI